MKKVLILGAKPNGKGLGPQLINGCKTRGINFEFIARWMLDIGSDGWLNKIDDLSSFDTIILNAYQHTDPGMQLRAFKDLLEKFSGNPNVQIVVIGSTYHYIDAAITAPLDAKTIEEYRAAKQELYDYFMKVALGGKYECKLLLFEPGVLGLKALFDNFCLTFDEAISILFNMIDMNLKFFQLSLMGAHKPSFQ